MAYAYPTTHGPGHGPPQPSGIPGGKWNQTEGLHPRHHQSGPQTVGQGFQQPGEDGEQYSRRMGHTPHSHTLGHRSDIFDQFQSNPMAGYAMNTAQSFLQSNAAQYTAGAESFWHSLKFYFAVNNSYVSNKLKILLLPIRHKSWKRLRFEESGGDNTTGNVRVSKYATPKNDINCPDLYLPLMSFVTYVLLVGFVKGTVGKFNPDVIGDIGTSCLLTQAFELLLLKLGFYLISTQISFLDMVAYTGYKYFSLVLNMGVGVLAGMLGFGGLAYYIALLYTGSMISIFMLNTLKSVVPEVGRGGVGRKRRAYLLLSISALQFVLIWWLGYNRELNYETEDASTQKL